MPLIEINDPDDPRLELYRDVKDRDLTGRDGLFMAEGKVVLERLFVSPVSVCISVLTTPERLKTLDISALAADVPVYVVTQAVMDAVAGFPIHRGYLALGRYGPRQNPTQPAACRNRPGERQTPSRPARSPAGRDTECSCPSRRGNVGP